jgi:PAS domain S-box-containing protein
VIRPERVPDAVATLFESLELSPDPVFITDRHHRIVFWNLSAERLLGFDADEAGGMSCDALLEGCDVHGNRYCTETCPVTQMAARGETVRAFGLRLRSKDGPILSTDVSILHFAGDSPDGFFLAHILKPSLDRTPAAADGAPPRSPLAAVRESPDARARKLTPREVDVLGMLAAGHPTADIATRLHISNLTARNHVQNILDKLEVHSKAEAVAFAFQKRLL